MPGPRPKPTHLKLLAGNPGHRPLPADEPQPDGDLRDAPEYFTANQARIWRYCIENAPEGLLKRLDTNVLERFVIAKAQFEEATRKVEELGLLVIVSKKNTAINPYLSIQRNAAKQMRAASDELGFSPAARTRVKVSGKKKSKSVFGSLKELKID